MTAACYFWPAESDRVLRFQVAAKGVVYRPDPPSQCHGLLSQGETFQELLERISPLVQRLWQVAHILHAHTLRFTISVLLFHSFLHIAQSLAFPARDFLHAVRTQFAASLHESNIRDPHVSLKIPFSWVLTLSRSSQEPPANVIAHFLEMVCNGFAQLWVRLTLLFRPVRSTQCQRSAGALLSQTLHRVSRAQRGRGGGQGSW